MSGMDKERLAHYKTLADKGLWDVSHPDIYAFYKRAQEEGVELVSNSVPQLGMFRAPYSKDIKGADIAIIGVPMDIGVPNPRPGTRLAPDAVRFWALDRNMVHYYNSLCPFDICNIIDWGNVEFQDDMYSLKSNLNELTNIYTEFRENEVIPLTIGGEHTITYSILKALGEKQPLSVIHLDAHGDTSVGFGGSEVSDASLLQNATVEGVIDPEKTVQIGQRGRGIIRCDFSKNSGMRLILADEFQQSGVKTILKEVKKIIGNTPCYLTIDSDVIDCSEMPGTTLPEPFGLTGREVRDFIRGLYGMNIVGADLMEVSPTYDPTGKSACLASGLTFELLCLLADSKSKRNGKKKQTHWK